MKSRLVLASLLLASAAVAADPQPQLFTKQQISDKFYSEGASFGDFNKDGKVDIVAGPFWYEGPDFTKRHQYFEDADAKSFDPHGYSQNFFQFVSDFNGDGYPDILVIGFPGKETSWYENPKGQEGPWKKHLALDVTDNESPTFGDLLGDGHPVLICMSRGHMGYAKPDPASPDKPWTFHPTSPKMLSYVKFTHGLGFGDVNGDGKMDLLDKDGWYEQPASLDGDPVWKRHAAKFGEGGSQMHVMDVNGDGLPDVVTAIAAHKYGLAWYEQTKEKNDNGDPKFVEHLITGEKPAQNAYGVAFSQPHAIAVAGIFGDGLPSFVTGKRWWAHAPNKETGKGGDPGVNEPAVLYVFRLVRHADHTAEFVPYLIDSDSGVGTQVTVGNVSGGKLPDIVVGNKKGVFLFTNQIDKLSKDAVEKATPKPNATAASAK